MKMWSLSVVCVGLGLIACGGEAASADPAPPTEVAAAPGTAPAAPAAAADPARAPFVGHWHNHDVATVIMTLNDAGRVRLSMGSAPCLGSYVVADGAMTMTYDPGQAGCTDFGIGGRVGPDGNTLSFGIFTTYDRDDATNETF